MLSVIPAQAENCTSIGCSARVNIPYRLTISTMTVWTIADLTFAQ